MGYVDVQSNSVKEPADRMDCKDKCQYRYNDSSYHCKYCKEEKERKEKKNE